MGTVMDVSDLVSQMQDTLAAIHSTLQSLDPKVHDAKFDDLEKKRDEAIKALTAAFSAEADELERKRKAEREEIIERRRKEDEERELRRREEDKDVAAKAHEEDEVRSRKLKEETEDVEQETDELMSRVEEEAHEAATKGREKLQTLQEKRRELNRLIEKQLEVTLPTLPVTPARRRSTRFIRTNTSPHSFTDKTGPETLKRADAPAHPGPEQQKADIVDEGPQEAPAASPSADDVNKSDSSPSLQEKMDISDRDAMERADDSPVQQNAGSQAEVSEATGWPLTQEGAVTDVVHDYREDLQERTAAPETDYRHLESPNSQHSLRSEATEPHKAEAISDTIKDAGIPEVEEGEVHQGQVAGERSSAGAVPSTDRESPEPFKENATSPNEEEYRDNHDYPPVAHPTALDTSVVAEAIPSPKHQLPGHRPALFMMATEAEPTPFYHHDLSDVEEASSASSPRQKDSEGDAYSQLSEASGPRPFSAHADPSGYVSDNGDAPDTSFSHRGESYIEENEISESERSHPDIPQVLAAGPSVVHAAESQGQGDTTDAGFEENLPRLHPLQTTEITREPSSTVAQQKIDKEKEGTSEQEKDRIPEPRAGEPNIPEQELAVDAAGYDNEPAQEHDEVGAPNSGVHDALGIQGGHVESELKDSGPSQDDTSPLLTRDPPPGPDDREHEKDDDKASVLKDSTATRRESSVDYMYKGYRRPSPEPYDIRPRTSERECEPERDGSHQSPGRRGHSDDDTDTESQRFVTPLPSQNSLRAYYQRENPPHDVATDDDYVGAYYEEEDPQQYELEHQHSTTVHGEDNLFDDTDQSDAPPADEEAETVTTSQQGTPVLPEHSEQTEEMQVGQNAEAQRIPEVTVKSPTSPEDPARKSWIEEVDSYFEEEGSVPQPETPPPQARGWDQGQGNSDPAQEDVQRESPVSTGSGLSTNHCNIQRPQTPTRHEYLASSSEATPEESTTRVRDATDTTYHVDDGWTTSGLNDTENNTPAAAASSNACAASSSQAAPAPHQTQAQSPASTHHHHYRESYPSPSHSSIHTHTARSPSTGTWPTHQQQQQYHQPPNISNPSSTTAPTISTGASFPYPPRGARFSPQRTRFLAPPQPHAADHAAARIRGRGGIDHARAWRGLVILALTVTVGEADGESAEEGERVVIAFVPSPSPGREDERRREEEKNDDDAMEAKAPTTALAAATGDSHEQGVTVLESNFDRLGVHSVTAPASVGEEGSVDDAEKEVVKGPEKGETEDAIRLRAKPAFGPGREASDTGARQPPIYTEAVGEARLAWMWVEGWRARLRKGNEVVEKARLEFQLDSREEVFKSVPVVVVEEREITGSDQE
ncbi:predicted protein [Chaetomium globosum CBS 148.51]|uniref:Uncharacterized protein n=1 Tax=Chaetomium globosum (strain ATCC 6205 / CBS 148.51 / DSM 1962 / NBRC 6347 / NRRL 1970) TaxID=306901 RepID=Q2GZF5_CHAGB|nr:uncharacterized protein CHGG_05091 [Chaetomium globosum CBS 148.51]EAQ88472.1 predicted protein [Chaetomium globosum CBS 148.51]